MTTVSNEGKIIRDAGFAQRLEQACDASFHCPPMHKGRLTWIADQLEKRFKVKVSFETVRKWLKGENKPRQAKNALLAQLLDVDSTWLYLGVDPDMTPRERKARNSQADGAVNLVAGFIQMDGGFPAFPEESDKRAQREHIDLYAIIRGANYAFHVSLAYQQDGDWRFPLPNMAEMPIVLGVVREGFSIRVIEINDAAIAAYGSGNSGTRMVVLSDDQVDAGKLTSFANRLP